MLPGRELAAITAARRLHVPDAVRHLPSDGSASTPSEVVSTVSDTRRIVLALTATAADAAAAPAADPSGLG